MSGENICASDPGHEKNNPFSLGSMKQFIATGITHANGTYHGGNSANFPCKPVTGRMDTNIHNPKGDLVPASYLEIVELPNGDIVLQRVDGEGEPLLNIRFSNESKAYLPEGRLEVARAMIHAGIQAVAELTGGDTNSDVFAADLEKEERTIH